MSHRRLIHRHRQRILTGTDRKLAPGEARLYSYYAPSLTGGLHTVTVSQHVSVPGDQPIVGKERELDIPPQQQTFTVLAPRFSLPLDVIDSVFPNPGSSAEHIILPHIVLRDPHLPWQRPPSHLPEGTDKTDLRRRPTWLALLSFPVDELLLAPEEIQKVMKNVPLVADSPDQREHRQTETCALRMRSRDTPLLQGVVNSTGFDTVLDARDAAELTNVVLLRKGLFQGLFSDPGTVPKTSENAGTRATGELNVAGFQYFAHVRHVATDGMAQAGAEADDAMFSVVVSRRTGPIDAETTTFMAAHLLSLDWDPTTVRLPLAGDDDTRVAVTSLHSWTYTCLASKNVASSRDRLEYLGDKLSVLRTREQPDAGTTDAPAPDDVERLVKQRQADGYTITRHRAVTGEETAAIFRGPLSPTIVKRPLHPEFKMESNFGTDLAIFDRNLGLLDITYSSAWQLGKTLAMGDAAFCTALGRLRSAVRAKGLDKSKKDLHTALEKGGHVSALTGSRRDAAERMVELVQGLNALNQALHEQRATAVGVNRWSTVAEDGGIQSLGQVDMVSQNSPHIATRIRAHADEAALEFAMTAEPKSDKQATVQETVHLYNEYGVPENPDYALVYSWVLDKLHLGNVPAHYLIPDPAFLPDESLRLFHVDINWTDALIDGALSLANHWGKAPDEDVERIAIKKVINSRLREADPKLGGWHVQLPRYGFILRSQLLVQFPDLAVSVQYDPVRRKPVIDGLGVALPYGVPPKQPILVQKRLAPDTMYCLFDAAPPDLQRITFTLPPHQQCFTVGQTLTKDKLIVLFKKVFTTDERPKIPEGKEKNNLLGEQEFDRESKQPRDVFNWDYRTINSAFFADFQRSKLSTEMGNGEFEDTVPTSAVLGLQLNDPILQLDIGQLATSTSSRVTKQELFQLSVSGQTASTPPTLPTAPERPRATVVGPIARPRPAPPTLEAALFTSALRNTNPPQPPAKPYAVPKLEIKVYPVRADDRSFIPSNRNLPVDLIFSLRPPRGEPIAYIHALTKILVGVPYGKMPANPDDPSQPTPLLAATADPPTPHMLSNMRLNVLKRWAAPDEEHLKGCVVFELVPRQSKGMPFAMLDDASFRLPRAQIARYTGKEKRWVWVRVLYEVDQKPPRADFKDGERIALRAE